MIEKQLSELMNHTLYVLKNPQVNPRETVTVVAMAIVLLLAVLAFASLFFMGKGRLEEEKPAPPPPPRSIAVDVAVIAGAALIAIAVVMGVFAAVSRRPAYCRSCHEMGRDYRSWGQSNHRGFECPNCHQEPGIFGYVNFKTRELNMVLARATKQYPRPISADVANASCLQCHGTDIMRPMTISGLRVRHSDMVEAGYKCVQCHNTAGHGAAVLNARQPSMDQCSTCHDGQKVFSTCSRCHVVDIGREVGTPSDYPAAHLPPLTTCRGCHAIEKCNRCHGLELPHPPGWLSSLRHAMPAGFERKELCAACHSEVFCGQCHTDFLGHGPQWKSQHGAAGPYNQQGCLGCHIRTTNICAICHPRYRGLKVKQPAGRTPREPPVPRGTKQF